MPLAPLILLTAAALEANPNPSRLLRSRPEFSGIARLRVMGSCTAFLIRPRPSPEAPVYVLTNGHCVLGGGVQNQVETNVPTRNGTAAFSQFFDSPNTAQPLRVKSIPYGTLKGLDIGVVELDTTWAQLDAMRVQPVMLSDAPLRRGDEVYSIGLPVNGIPAEEQWLRRSDCAVERIAQLAEGPWKFHDALRLRCGAVFGGASGSPVFDKRTNRVAAIINTSTQGNTFSSGDFVCFTSSPCELGENGAHVELDAGYALPLGGIDGCFDNGGRFNLRQSTCTLDPGIEFPLRGAPLVSVRPGASWDIALGDAPYTHYRYKTGREHEVDCRDERGYSGPIEASTRFNQEIPKAEARYVLCLLGGAGGRWQPARFATYVHTAVDATPPVISPFWDVFGEENGYSVRMNFLVPDISDYRYKFGPASVTVCDANDGYQIYRRVPIRVPAQSELVRFCILAGDRNDNFTRPTAILLGPQQPLPGGFVHAAGFRQGPLSPGAIASLFTASEFPAREAAFTIRDAAGVEHTIVGATFGQQVNLLLPRTLAIGPAELRVPSTLPSSVRFEVRPVSPGLYATFDRQPRSVPAKLTLALGGMALVDSADVAVWIAGQRLSASYQAGVVECDIPAGFPYRGYVPVQVEAFGVRSNTAYYWLRDEGI
ncbi:MAG: trypsin-like peptidase domain-containing protein [Acidobacteria bacterium]|nr:trypsin-like peptidase domain-containing protein [Acidobacteriota bacterium]